MQCIRPVSSAAAVYLCEKLAASPRELEKNNYYVVPGGNPDAASGYFAEVRAFNPGNATPVNDDLDENTDEDGCEDLNGDGFITLMRVRHPEGDMVTAGDEPRLMRAADRTKGESGVYRIYSEGIDNDGDGLYNEDGPGGTNVNLNFPHLFSHSDKGTGLYPGSAPEARGILEYVFRHPEIAMAVAFGETNFCIRTPQ